MNWVVALYTVVITMSSGTPMKVPGIPHTSPQKNTATITISGDSENALPASRGSR
ncbi:hypothetical protein D3C85_1679120 [compost metagenome]